MPRVQVTLRLEQSVVDWFRDSYPERGYQTAINDVLAEYVATRKRGDGMTVENFLKRAALAGVAPDSRTWMYAWAVLVAGRSQTEVAEEFRVEISTVGHAARKVRDGRDS